MAIGLFGEDFEITIKKPAAKDVINKATKQPMTSTTSDVDKVLKSKKVSLQEKLAVINAKVLEKLGKQKENVLVIKSRQQFHDYITTAIKFGRIAIDTETDNSLDAITCKLMGLCLYVKGNKQVYIPINHRDSITKERLSWQLTEQDINEELQRVLDSKIDIIMHNGKFDYEVIKCTCKIAVPPKWDTMIGARLLNENELAGLKWQYINKVDKTQEKYDIEGLFEKVVYADVDPSIFALYAATDAMMTDRLYELQVIEFERPEYGPHMDLLGTHEIKGLKWLFHEVEMPIVTITAEMELAGVTIDEQYGKLLQLKYNSQLETANDEIAQILKSLVQVIADWKLSKEANTALKMYASKKSKMSKEKLEATYPYEDNIGRYKIGKAPVEILDDPINLDSPTQLAIVFYDILGVPNNAKDGSRKTGKDELKAIKETLAGYLPKLEEIDTEIDEEDLEDDFEEAIEVSQDKAQILKLGSAAKLADLLLTRRKIVKLITTYIEVIPNLAKHWPDGRIRFHMNSLGTDTGRYSSGGKWHWLDDQENSVTVSGINIQNIPSHNPEIRMLFKAAVDYHKVEINDNYYAIPETDEVETSLGWKKVKELQIGDIMLGDDTQDIIKYIEKRQDIFYVYIV